jgi:hypothetical protein
MNGQEPAITQTDPRAYYLWLQTQRVPALQAAQMVQQRFPVQSPEERARQQASQAQSNALAQTAGTVGGILVTQEAMRNFPNVREWMGTGQQPGTPTTGAPQPTTPTIPTTPTTGQAPTSTPSSIPATEVGSVTMPDGSPGVLMSDGAKVGKNGQVIKPDGSPGGSIQGQALAGMQVLGGVAQAYNGYKQYQSGEKLGGAANIAGGAYTAAAGAQSLASGGAGGSLGAYVPYVGAGVAAAQIGQQALNEKGASEDRAAKSQAEALKASMLFIPGYGWVAYAALAGLDAATGGKATEGLVKFSGFNNKITDKIDFGLGKSIRSKVFHQSTKGRQEERTGQLLRQSDDPQWQNYVASMRLQQVKEGPKDKTKPFYKGTYATFDEYKKAGLQADDLTGVYGNLDAFKPDYAETKNLPNWAQLTFDQRKAVTQRLIDENMYASKKGDVVIPDKEKARRIYEEMAANNFGVSRGRGSNIRGSLETNLNKPQGPQIRPPAPLPPTEQIIPQAKPSFQDIARGKVKVR